MRTENEIREALQALDAEKRKQDKILLLAVDAILSNEEMTTEQKITALIEERAQWKGLAIAIDVLKDVVGDKPAEAPEKPKTKRGRPKKQEAKQKQVKKQKAAVSKSPKEVDTGKILALAAAKWSAAKIADEMGIDEETVLKVFRISTIQK